jgi:hypothetical protein
VPSRAATQPLPSSASASKLSRALHAAEGLRAATKTAPRAAPKSILKDVRNPLRAEDAAGLPPRSPVTSGSRSSEGAVSGSILALRQQKQGKFAGHAPTPRPRSDAPSASPLRPAESECRDPPLKKPPAGAVRVFP